MLADSPTLWQLAASAVPWEGAAVPRCRSGCPLLCPLAAEHLLNAVFAFPLFRRSENPLWMSLSQQKQVLMSVFHKSKRCNLNFQKVGDTCSDTGATVSPSEVSATVWQNKTEQCVPTPALVRWGCFLCPGSRGAANPTVPRKRNTEVWRHEAPPWLFTPSRGSAWPQRGSDSEPERCS